MKRVVGYARISTEDQSHFSISGQVEQITDYCNHNNYELVDVFVDEGQSAKNFNRRAWKKLEDFLKKNHKNIDLFVVLKYDRFSRNLQEALTVIQKLEGFYNIKIISIQEPIGIPFDSPFFFQMRTQMLLQAHVERLVISSRVKFGMEAAKKEGRFLGFAPYGYVNARDAKGKPILLIDEEKAKMVRFIYEKYLQNYSFTETTRLAKAKGFTQKAKEAVFRILTNHVYISEIKFKLNDGSIVYIPAIHEPILDEVTFNRVQALINRGVRVVNRFNDTTYLKGSIICPDCRKLFTNSRSKGKYKYYWYYECAFHRTSYNATVAHDKFDKILEELSFEDHQIQYLKEKIISLLDSKFKNDFGDVTILKKRKAAVQSKKKKLEEKYLENKIDDEMYSEWHKLLKKELHDVNVKINSMKDLQNNYDKYFKNSMKYLSSIKDIFHLATAPEKLNFIDIVFGKELIYDGSIYRTHFFNPIFSSKILILSNKNLLLLYKKDVENEDSSLGNPNEIQTRIVRTGI